MLTGVIIFFGNPPLKSTKPMCKWAWACIDYCEKDSYLISFELCLVLNYNNLVANKCNVLKLMCDVFFLISVGKDEKKKEKKEDSEKTVRDNIRKSLKEILTTRYGIQNYTWKLCYFRLLTKVIKYCHRLRLCFGIKEMARFLWFGWNLLCPFLNLLLSTLSVSINLLV